MIFNCQSPASLCAGTWPRSQLGPNADCQLLPTTVKTLKRDTRPCRPVRDLVPRNARPSVTNVTQFFLEKMHEIATELGIAFDVYLREKLDELEERRRIGSLPNISWFIDHPHDLDVFLDRVGFTRRDSDRQRLKERIREFYSPGVRTKIEDHTEGELLRLQQGRCHACGELLKRMPKNYGADHLLSYASAAHQEISNWQLLCDPCNTGKGDSQNYATLAAWRISNSDLRSTAKSRNSWPSCRYAVLARDEFRCSECKSTTLQARLWVKMRIPWGAGGQLAFDNLIALCEHCADEAGDDGTAR